MKVCSHCLGTAFDDMAICYGCLQPFDDQASLQASFLSADSDANDRFLFEEPIEEPIEEPSERATAVTVAVASQVRFHVEISGLFAYDIYLNRTEEAQLMVGCARDNNIVLPHTEAKRHLLRLYYAQGAVWVQDRGSNQQALVDGVPLTGVRCLKRGVALEVGEARIELVDD
jgi:hypothetical protein